MSGVSPSTEALTVARGSPYPISAGGDGVMYACSLFASVAITCLLVMRLIATGRQLWCDRGTRRYHELKWFRLTIALICIAGISAKAPDAVYKIAWNEVTPATLHTILTVKEWLNAAAFWIVIGWLGILTYFEPVWTLKLANPLNKVWGGNRTQVRRFGLIVLLSGLLAGAIALSKAFS